MKFLRPASLGIAAFLLGLLQSSASILYETDFENFTPGADNLVGTDGWVATVTGQELHGIDDEIISGLGNSAYLGFFRPASNSTQTVTVFKPLTYDPIAAGEPIVEFETLIGIAASKDDPDTQFVDESTREDRFLLTVYNIDGEPLASVIYDTRSNTFGLYRNNGSASFDTGFEFVIDEPQFLYFAIDMENNTWSATLDGAPIFTNALFNGTGRDRTLGTIAAEWNITNRFNPGDNWMLFDDWIVTAKARTTTFTEPFEIKKVERTADQKIQFTYPADAGCTYTVQSSTDLKTWRDLPNSPVTATQSDPAAKHTDAAPITDQRLYYRVLRAVND